MARNNITRFALDSNRYTFFGVNEAVTPKHNWTDGTRDTAQAVDPVTKNPLWIVNVQMRDQIKKLADTANVTVASATEPRIGFMAEVSFENLELLAMSRKEEYGVSYNFTATAIKPPNPKTTTTTSKKAA